MNTLVLSGGSNKGNAYVGGFRALEEAGLKEKIQRHICVSVGTIFGLSAVLGYTVAEAEEIALEYPGFVKRIELQDIIDVFSAFGLDRSPRMRNLIVTLLRGRT